MTDEILEKASKIKSDIATLDKIIFPAGISDELLGELKEWVNKQKKRLEKEFKRLDDIDEFIGYCYVNGIDFLYMNKGEENGKWFCDKIRNEFDEYEREANKGMEIPDKEPEMTKEEMKTYLMSTGLYENTDTDMFYEDRMMDTDKTIPIKNLVERVVSVDKEFGNKPWNIRQILTNIDMIVPLEDRK